MRKTLTSAGASGWKRRYLLVTLAMLLGSAPAFAESPPTVWPFSNVYTIGASVDGGSTPISFGDLFHRFAFQRDEDATYTIVNSQANGLGRHNFTVPVTRPDKRHAWVAGQTCRYIPYTNVIAGCGPWSDWQSVWAEERPGRAGELKGFGGNNAACADVLGFQTDNGSPIGHFSCWGGGNQKWSYTAWQHNLRGLASKCLSAWGSNGDQAGLVDCVDLASERWYFTRATIRGLNGMCADAPGGTTSNGTQAQMYDCNGTGAQLFNFVDMQGNGVNAQIRGPGGQCLDVLAFGTGNGTPVVFWNCNGLPNQEWTVDQNGEIRGWGGKCLDVTDFGYYNTAKLQMWDCHGGTNQKFWITGELRNYFNQCLDIPLNSPMGTPLQAWQCWGGNNQQWQYTP